MLVALIGQPNSGKSALLHRLTGARVVTSNYPGTTVELVSGNVKGPRGEIAVLDTPGIYSLAATSKEQEVTKGVLESKNPDLVLNVVDATNLPRHLSLTLSLLRYGIPMVVALNSSDRLGRLGLSVDAAALSARLGVPVVLTSALTGEGVKELRSLIIKNEGQNRQHRGVEGPGGVGLPRGTVGRSLHEEDLRRYQELGARIANEVVTPAHEPGPGLARRQHWGDRLEDGLDRPFVSLVVLGLGLVASWKGIAWAIPYAEITVRAVLAPVAEILSRFLEMSLPPGRFSEVLTYAIPEGIVLPLATVLPAMIIAYTLIALLEDSGLLGRYAALSDALTRLLNLPGQALIPFLLAFGCRVPALMSARILPSGESRRAASIVIATVIPCTATVSLAATALARFKGNLAVPMAAVCISIVLLARFLGFASGQARDPLVLELPPIRFPILKNVLVKTQMRVSGFFGHVLPLVVGMNVAIRLLASGGGVFGWNNLSVFAERLLGIPPEALFAVVLTMFQRYLAPLFLIQLPLTAREATIAVTMVALGLPCLPSAVTLWREMGIGTVALSFAISATVALAWGMLLNLVLP